MKKKKTIYRICIACVIGVLCSCQKTEVVKTISIVYGTVTSKEGAEQYIDFYTKKMEYANKVFIEKHIPYQVEMKFITNNSASLKSNAEPNAEYYEQLKKMKSNDDKVDIIRIFHSALQDPSKNRPIDEGLLLTLDDYYDTNKGKELYQAFPHTLLESLEVDNRNYYIPCDFTNINESYEKGYPAIVYDVDFAKEYDIDVAEWGEQLWEHEEEILKIGNLHATKGPLLDRSGVMRFMLNARQLTPLFSDKYIWSQFGINETTGKIMSIYEDAEFQQNADILQKIYQMGYIKESNGLERSLFYFSMPYDYEKCIEPNIVMDDYYVNNINTSSIGIASWTKQENDVKDFLHLINTDKELSTVFAYGEEGVDYYLENDRVYDDVTKTHGFVPYTGLGNPFISPIAAIDPIHENGQDLYESMNRLQLSKGFGFTFDDRAVKKEMKQIEAISLDNMNENLDQIMLQIDYRKQLEKLNEAGLQKVLTEMNRQFQVFLEDK